MAKQFSDTVRNGMADSFETSVGASPFLQIRTGAQPANCAAAASGTLISEIALPADFMQNAAAGVKALLGTWAGTVTSSGTNTAAHYRIVNNAKTVCHEQGSVSITGGGGDLELQNTSLANGQPVNITSWNLTIGGA